MLLQIAKKTTCDKESRHASIKPNANSRKYQENEKAKHTVTPSMQAVDVIMGEIIHLIVEQVVFARGLIE